MDWKGAEPNLATERLALRAFRLSDLEEVAAIDCDPEVTYFWGIAPRTPEESLDALRRTLARRRQRPRKILTWCVRLSESKAFLGSTLLRVLNRDWNELEVGYRFAKASWGHGYATEAVQATLDFAFQDLKAHRVVANCFPQNAPSRRLLERLGFRLEGQQIESYFEHEAWQDNVQYALLAREWQGLAATQRSAKA